MLRTLFLLLWVIAFLGAPPVGAVEIYVEGHKYDSFQAYQDAKRSAAQQAKPGAAEDYIKEEARHLGIDKTAPDAILHKLYVLSIERGIVSALQGFYHGGQSDLLVPLDISSGQLQGAIKKAVTTSQEPKLLIVQPGKVRILSLSTDNSQPQAEK